MILFAGYATLPEMLLAVNLCKFERSPHAYSTDYRRHRWAGAGIGASLSTTRQRCSPCETPSAWDAGSRSLHRTNLLPRRSDPPWRPL